MYHSAKEYLYQHHSK